MINNIKISSFFLIVAIIMSAYYFFYLNQINAPVKAEWWLKEAITKKTNLLSKVNGENRIIILSGSNSLFGFDSSLIEKEFNIPTFNFGLHASLDLSYLSGVAKKVIKKGDIVIAPLEYSFYTMEGKYSDWFVNNMLAWGSDYISQLSAIDKASFFSHTSAQRVIEGVMTEPRRVVATDYDINRFKPNGSYNGYSYKSIKSNGDVITPIGSTEYVKELMANHKKHHNLLSYQSNMRAHDYGMEQILRLKKVVEGKGGTLIVIWPVSMKSDSFNEKNETSTAFINSIKKSMAEKKIEIKCDNYEFNIDQDNFFDTYYHLNKKGEVYRTNKVIACLKRENLVPQRGT